MRRFSFSFSSPSFRISFVIGLGLCELLILKDGKESIIFSF